MIRILFTPWCLFILLGGSAQEEVNLEDISKKVDELILKERKLDFKGSILIAQGDKIVHHKNYGLDQSKDYSFWIGSLSKQFCAAAILKLQDEGKLSVNDPISKFIEVPQSMNGITFHQLLTHSSGLPDQYAADGISSQNKALDALLTNEISLSIEYSYSNDGYQLLAVLVEIISGKPYALYLQETFFQPLEMTNSGTAGDNKKWESLNIPSSRKLKKGNPQDWQHNYGYKGSTGVLTSTEDLMKWKVALFGNQSLSGKATSLLFQRHVEKSNELFYGYGWNIFDSSNGEVIVHSGSDDFTDHNSTFRYYKDKDLTIIVLSHDGVYKGTEKSRALTLRIIPLVFDP